MADLQGALQAIPGRQAFHLNVPGTDAAAALSVVSFTATEEMGEPNVVHIELTHPQQLLRADFLSRGAVFSITADDGAVRRFSGFIARFSAIRTTHDFTQYEVELQSHLGRLKAVTRNRIFQHATTPDILAAGLRSHGLRDHQFSFRLRRQYPQHAFRMQYGMADFAYSHMMQQKAGVYSYVTEVGS